MDAGRRPHAVRGRRSDAVDLPLPRCGGAPLPRGAAPKDPSATCPGAASSTSRATSARRGISWRGPIACFPRVLATAQRAVARRGRVRRRGGRRTRRRDDGPPTLDLVAKPRGGGRVASLRASTPPLAAGAEDVAILVRARGDLDAILPALRAAAIPFAAVELDALGARQAVLDLLALTHALLQPADRLASLVGAARAVVRARARRPLRCSRAHLEHGLAGLFERTRRDRGVVRRWPRAARAYRRRSCPGVRRARPRRHRRSRAWRVAGARRTGHDRRGDRLSRPSRISSRCCARMPRAATSTIGRRCSDELARALRDVRRGSDHARSR